MSKRSKWKGPFISSEFINDFFNNIKIRTTKQKSSTIVPIMLGKTFFIYNGKNYIKLKPNSNMVGFKLGQFITTRVRHIFRKKAKRK